MREGITSCETSEARPCLFLLNGSDKIFRVGPNDFLGGLLGPRNSFPISDTKGDRGDCYDPVLGHGINQVEAKKPTL